jgi:hypothetical protein
MKNGSRSRRKTEKLKLNIKSKDQEVAIHAYERKEKFDMMDDVNGRSIRSTIGERQTCGYWEYFP